MEIVKKLKARLKNKSGSTNIYTVGFLLLMIVLMSVVYEFITAFTVVQGVHDITSQAVVSAAADNYYNTFVGVKESNTYADLVQTEEVENRLKTLLKLDSTMAQYIGKSLNFRIEGLQVTFVNAEMSEEGTDETLHFETVLNLTVPLRMGGSDIYVINKRLLVKSTYIALF